MITFSCKKFIPNVSSSQICEAIADLESWKLFEGYLFLPGIKEATFRRKTENMIGTEIRVQNGDGSAHTETIYKWNPEKEVAMRFSEFSAPLDKIATHFVEEWHFTAQNNGTFVERYFELHPTSILTRPFLWLISQIFRRAIDKNLAQMANSFL